MGRRALPKVDPNLELSFHLHTVDELPVPWDAGQLFDREGVNRDGALEDKPLEVEMGSGKGLFLQNAALNNPDHNFLGVEVARKYAHFTAARLHKSELNNAISIYGDGLKLFRELLPDESLTAVHVYFPDPWWKRRHLVRRVLNEAFLADVVRTLKPQCKLHFWTDVKEYFDSTLKLIADKTPLVGPLEVPQRTAEHDLDYRTHFERRTRMNEAPVYRAQFVKEEVVSSQ